MGDCSSKVPEEKKYTKLELINMEIDKIVKFQRSQNKKHDAQTKHKESQWKLLDTSCPISYEKRWKTTTINHNEFAIIETDKGGRFNIFKSIYIYNWTQHSWRKSSDKIYDYINHRWTTLDNDDEDHINNQISKMMSENEFKLISRSFDSKKQLLYLLSYRVGSDKSIYDYKLGIFNIQNKQFKVHKFKMETKDGRPIDGAYSIMVNDILQLFIPKSLYHGNGVTTTHLMWDDNLQSTEQLHIFDSELMARKPHRFYYMDIDVLIYDKSHECILLFSGYNIYSYCMIADEYNLSKLEITTPIKFDKSGFVMTNDSRYILLFGGWHDALDGQSDSHKDALWMNMHGVSSIGREDPFQLNCIYIYDIAERVFMKSNVECPKRIKNPTITLLDKSIILISGCIKQWYNNNNDLKSVNIVTKMVLIWCSFGNRFEYIHLIGKYNEHWVISVSHIVSNAITVGYE